MRKLGPLGTKVLHILKPERVQTILDIQTEMNAGLHTATSRESIQSALTVLVSKGLVTRCSVERRHIYGGRTSYAYTLTTQGVEEQKKLSSTQ